MTFLFSGRRRLRGSSQESLCDDNNVSDTWPMTRDTGEELAVTGCDPTRDTPSSSSSSSSPPRQPSPPFLSPRGSPRPGPLHSQSRLWLLYLVLVTLISCAGRSHLYMAAVMRMSTSYFVLLVKTEQKIIFLALKALAEPFSVLHIPELSYAEFISNYGPI